MQARYQLDFFATAANVETEKYNKLKGMIAEINTNAMTPLEALIMLEKLKASL